MKETGSKSRHELKKGITRRYRSEDAHVELYGKEFHEFQYGKACPICGSRIDERNLCACGGGHPD